MDDAHEGGKEVAKLIEIVKRPRVSLYPDSRFSHGNDGGARRDQRSVWYAEADYIGARSIYNCCIP
jgi:hypothetical protein